MSFLSKLAKILSGASAGRSLVEDASDGAVWMSKTLTSSGYRADFSIESLGEVDRFFDEQVTEGQARAGGLLAKNLGRTLFCLGAYCGEVIRRHRCGTWMPGGQEPDAEINLALQLPDGSVIWPVQRAMKRYRFGREDSLVAYAASIEAT